MVDRAPKSHKYLDSLPICHLVQSVAMLELLGIRKLTQTNLGEFLQPRLIRELATSGLVDFSKQVFHVPSTVALPTLEAWIECGFVSPTKSLELVCLYASLEDVTERVALVPAAQWAMVNLDHFFLHYSTQEIARLFLLDALEIPVRNVVPPHVLAIFDAANEKCQALHNACCSWLPTHTLLMM